MDEKLRLEYIPLSKVRKWDNNLKLHDIGTLIASVQRYGYKDPAKFEPELNAGKGGIVEGNGRTEVLEIMSNSIDPETQKPYKCPRGILEIDGEWHVPVLFGVDAKSEKAAEAYGVDHNAITLSGGDFGLSDHMRLWDVGFDDFLLDLGDEFPTVFDGEDLTALAGWGEEKYTAKIEIPTYEPSEFKPRISDLVDTMKADTLIKAITQNAELPEDEKAFLKIAAYRHVVFDFDKIADYYANSGKLMQSLMEDSALVIIDVDRAIENGFMQATEEIFNLLGDEYE